jgi:hypothetical protein
MLMISMAARFRRHSRKTIDFAAFTAPLIALPIAPDKQEAANPVLFTRWWQVSASLAICDKRL